MLALPASLSQGQRGATGRTRELDSQAHVYIAFPSPPFNVLTFLLCMFSNIQRSGENGYIEPQGTRHPASVLIHILQSYLIYTPPVFRRGLKDLKAEPPNPITSAPNT